MSNVLYFPNLRAIGEKPTATGTDVTDAALVDHSCLDVFVRNDSTNPIFATTSESQKNILGQDIHDAATTGVNGSAGAYVAFGAAVTIPATTKKVQISSTMGEPLEISFADVLANAGASVKKVYLVQGGAPGTIDFSPGTSNKVFIKSLSTTAISEGYVTVNFIG